MSSSTSATVRQVEPHELDVMEAVLTVFGEAFEDVETYGSARPGPDYFRRLLSSDYFIAVAAMKGEEVAGALAAYELQKFEQERSEIYINDLVVASAHRRERRGNVLSSELRDIVARR